MMPTLSRKLLLSVLILSRFFGLSADAQTSCPQPNHPLFDDITYYGSGQNQTGQALRSALNSIIKDHTSFSYSCVWTIPEQADEGIANAGNIIALYTNRSILKSQELPVNQMVYFCRGQWAGSSGVYRLVADHLSEPLATRLRRA